MAKIRKISIPSSIFTDRTIKKTKHKSTVKKSVFIPSSILKNRSLSVLEAISQYLKEKKGMTYHEIAVLLNRDDRTIWTCCNRARKKYAK